MCLSYVGWSSKQKGKPWCSWTHDLAYNSGAWPCADAAGIHWQRLCILPIHIKEIFKEHFGAVYVLQTGSSYFPLLWSSKKQNSTARSTTEAELIACASALFGEAFNLHTMIESLNRFVYLFPSNRIIRLPSQLSSPDTVQSSVTLDESIESMLHPSTKNWIKVCLTWITVKQPLSQNTAWCGHILWALCPCPKRLCRWFSFTTSWSLVSLDDGRDNHHCVSEIIPV